MSTSHERMQYLFDSLGGGVELSQATAEPVPGPFMYAMHVDMADTLVTRS